MQQLIHGFTVKNIRTGWNQWPSSIEDENHKGKGIVQDDGASLRVCDTLWEMGRILNKLN